MEKNKTMSENITIHYPLDFKFRISTLSNDFTVTDVRGVNLAYVRQKMFRLKESVQVYKDEKKVDLLYNINANQWLDFNTMYTISEPNGAVVGSVARKGMRSIWKATYNVLDKHNQVKYIIEEESAWVKFWDGLVSEIPLVGMFTGYFLNPAYLIKTVDGKVCFRMKKQSSFFGRKFRLEKVSDNFDTENEMLIISSLMMMLLLERSRG